MVKTRLAEILKEKNITQKELSIKADARPSTISSLCNNTAKTISFTLIDNICTALGCKVSDLFEQVEPQPKNDLHDMQHMDIKRLYEKTAGTKPSKIEIINLSNEEFDSLQTILSYMMSINSNDAMTTLSINFLIGKIVDLATKLDTCVVLLLSNDSFLDDFTQTFYYIVVAYNHIEEFKDYKSFIENIYKKFLKKIDDETFNKIVDLAQKNYNIFTEEEVTR